MIDFGSPEPPFQLLGNLWPIKFRRAAESHWFGWHWCVLGWLTSRTGFTPAITAYFCRHRHPADTAKHQFEQLPLSAAFS